MSGRQLAIFGGSALALLIGWAYWPILGNGLVWDDGGNLIGARKLWDGGLAGIRWAFSEPFAGHYQPLTWLSYRLDAALSGATPRGLHATQLFLHLLVTLAVALLAAELARSPALRGRPSLQGPLFPLAAAALFGLAPIRVESVAWATERRDLLGALFTLAAVFLHLRSCRSSDWGLGPGLARRDARGDGGGTGELSSSLDGPSNSDPDWGLGPGLRRGDDRGVSAPSTVLASPSDPHSDWGLGPGLARRDARGDGGGTGELSSILDGPSNSDPDCVPPYGSEDLSDRNKLRRGDNPKPSPGASRRARPGPSPHPNPSWFRAGIAVLAACSALSRAQMTLPLLLLLLDVWPLDRLAGAAGRERFAAFGRLIGEKAVLLAIAAASAVAAMWAQASSGALTTLAEHGPLERIIQAGYGLAFYPVSTFLPGAFGRLLPLYERPVPFLPLEPRYLLPALAAAVALAAICLWRRRLPATFTAAGAYLLLVLPVLGIAQSGIQLVADRYAYLATAPLVLLAAAGFALAFGAVRETAPRAGMAVLLIASLVAGAVATRRQTHVWQDDLTLWRQVLAHSESSLADNNLGQILAARGEAGVALLHLTRCLEESPQYPRPWNALAVLLEAPWPADAPPAPWVAATLAQALAWQPGLPAARYATALAHFRAGDEARAERELRRLLAVDPAHDGARLALARIESRR